jgi:glycosyltransferase involved in cell wall biosynthesis
MSKLSIITINLNDKTGLLKTIKSVVSQTFKDYEYLIIDGGSTDGSIDVIKHFADHLSYWESKQDKGIYSAMNRGILKAKGDYCLFLNSGDYLVDNTIIQKVFSDNNTQDLLCGDMLMGTYLKTCPDKFTFEYLLYDYLPHESIFIKRDLFEKVGLYNETLNIVADHEFFTLAIAYYNCTYKRLPFLISYFNRDGISSNPKSEVIIQQERSAIFQKYFPFIIDEYKELINARNELRNLKTSKFFKYGYKWSQLIKQRLSIKKNKISKLTD